MIAGSATGAQPREICTTTSVVWSTPHGAKMHLRPDLVSPGTVSTLQSVADRDALVAPLMLSKGVGGTDVSYLHPL